MRIKGDNAHRAFRTSLELSVQSVDVCFYDCGPGPAGNRKQGSLPPCILLATENNEEINSQIQMSERVSALEQIK